MGFYPSSPEYLNFPQPLKEVGKMIKGKRAHSSMRGTRKHPGQSSGVATMRRPRTIWKLLSEQAALKGWHNGVRIHKGAAT